MPKVKYDWDRLFRRQRFTLWRGDDYTCSQSSMAQQIRNAASLRCVRVRVVEVQDDGGGFTVMVMNHRHREARA